LYFNLEFTTTRAKLETSKPRQESESGLRAQGGYPATLFPSISLMTATGACWFSERLHWGSWWRAASILAAAGAVAVSAEHAREAGIARLKICKIRMDDDLKVLSR